MFAFCICWIEMAAIREYNPSISLSCHGFGLEIPYIPGIMNILAHPRIILGWKCFGNVLETSQGRGHVLKL